MSCQTKRNPVAETQQKQPSQPSFPDMTQKGCQSLCGGFKQSCSGLPGFPPSLSQADGNSSLITTMPWSWPKKESIKITLWASTSIALSRDVGVGRVLLEAKGIDLGCRGNRSSSALWAYSCHHWGWHAGIGAHL